MMVMASILSGHMLDRRASFYLRRALLAGARGLATKINSNIMLLPVWPASFANFDEDICRHHDGMFHWPPRRHSWFRPALRRAVGLLVTFISFISAIQRHARIRPWRSYSMVIFSSLEYAAALAIGSYFKSRRGTKYLYSVYRRNRRQASAIF